MKNLKIILIVLIMLIFLIAITIGILLLSSKLQSNMYPDESGYDPPIIVKDTLEKVSIRNNYYTVKNIIEDYYTCLSGLNKTEEDVMILEEDVKQENINFEENPEKENIKNRIYGFFEESNIKETGLSRDNIQEKLGNYKDLYIQINDMYVREITESIKVYFAYGDITEKENLQKEKFELMVAVDSQNSTFNLYTSDYVKKHNFFELSKEKDFKEKHFNIEIIENRKYNRYYFEIINTEQYCQNLLNSYVESIKYNDINYLYSRLNEEYKTKKFPNMAEYEKYIQENKTDIMRANLKRYKENKYEGYKQYICIDQAENYYIFNETSVMDYKLILDPYTIDIPEVVEQYNEVKEQEKVGLNIEKIILAINDKDYRYVYSKLDNTFKKTQFPTEESLKKYLENNLYDKNKIEYNEFSQQGNIYIYKTKITDKNVKNSKEKNLNIIMQLGQGTSFAMSFNME